jgi:hypothetical protein
MGDVPDTYLPLLPLRAINPLPAFTTWNQLVASGDTLVHTMGVVPVSEETYKLQLTLCRLMVLP